MPTQYGSFIWHDGRVEDEEKLKGQFQHLADHHMIDDVGTQVAAPSGHVPPAIEEARQRVEAELKKTYRYNALTKSV